MRRRPKLLLAIIALALGAAAFSVLRKRRAAAPPPLHLQPSWPPFEPDPEPDPEPATAPDWAEPVDGQCPDGYPIKANANSGIFHMPDGRSYARTIPERCYATAEAAARDGYRRAKL